MFSRSWNGYSSSKTKITRETHLESYLNDPTLKASTRKVGTGDSTYDTVFQTKGGSALIIRIHLSQSNPAPMMTLIGIEATHPWIDKRMRITGYSNITSDNAWSNSGLTLGKAVNDVVRHFQLYPPADIQITDMSLLQIQNRMNDQKKKLMHDQNQNNPSQQANVPAHRFATVTEVESDLPRHFSEVLVYTDNDIATNEAIMSAMYMPSLPTSFPEVDNMEITEINDLLRDDTLFKKEMHKLPYVKEMESLKMKKSLEIYNTAKDNMEKEEELKSLQNTVEDLQNSLKEKVSAYTELQKKQIELCKPADVKTTIKKLMIAKRATYNESEDIASDWIDNETDHNEFIKSFIETRTIHHVRAAKIERVQNM